MSTRFILIGGFLGAGKTTTIARLAALYRAQGKHVAIVTNDKAPELVDTLSLMAQGYPVAELAGTCFCGNVDELTQAIDDLRLPTTPDVVLAEPVGSCIDMVATVIQPMMAQRREQYKVAPYGVVFKPSHGLKILRGDPLGGFSPKAEYLFRKQLEEADFVALNRVDQLSPEAIDELTALVARDYPQTPLIRMSALTGTGFDELQRQLAAPGSNERRTVTVDYDAYAAGEAELGWLNAGLIVQSREPFELDALLISLIDEIRGRLRTAGAETAHLKVLGAWGGQSAVANLVSNDLPAELSKPSQASVTTAHLTINARVALEPDQLSELVTASVAAVAHHWQLQTDTQQLQSFRPGRPGQSMRVTDLLR
jgi:G3E family GTPase